MGLFYDLGWLHFGRMFIFGSFMDMNEFVYLSGLSSYLQLKGNP